jgi:hypothetical protein
MPAVQVRILKKRVMTLERLPGLVVPGKAKPQLHQPGQQPQIP